MTNANIELSPALIARMAEEATAAGYTAEERDALLEVLGERSSQLSITWFQQVTPVLQLLLLPHLLNA